MCAIAGIISKRAEVRIEPDRIESMIRSIKHRGPDETGYYRTGSVQLAMARLSILDPKSTGLCPIIESGTSGDRVLLHNGEIYNYIEIREELEARGYTFRTGCDSEVLLKSYLEWGQDCLGRFNGMFAFVIADFANDLLFAARDRAGEKPLYYFETDTESLIHSEPKAILTQVSRPEPSLRDKNGAFR